MHYFRKNKAISLEKLSVLRCFCSTVQGRDTRIFNLFIHFFIVSRRSSLVVPNLCFLKTPLSYSQALLSTPKSPPTPHLFQILVQTFILIKKWTKLYRVLNIQLTCLTWFLCTNNNIFFAFDCSNLLCCVQQEFFSHTSFICIPSAASWLICFIYRIHLFH